jgi:hypothetical protein
VSGIGSLRLDCVHVLGRVALSACHQRRVVHDCGTERNNKRLDTFDAGLCEHLDLGLGETVAASLSDQGCHALKLDHTGSLMVHLAYLLKLEP